MTVTLSLSAIRSQKPSKNIGQRNETAAEPGARANTRDWAILFFYTAGRVWLSLSVRRNMLNHLESDFPWTLYFQGIAMPKWSNCWHFQPVADSDVDWYVEQVHGR